MIRIPGGECTIGRDGAGDAQPAHRVVISPFYLDRTEVTNAEYLAFCRATGHKLPEFWGMEVYRSGEAYPTHPVVGVSWGDAVAYADWRGVRLPTEAEWECAARGGLVGKKYSHGDERDPDLYAPSATTGTGGPAPVASFPPNGFGLYDMTGNAAEWVQDIYTSDYYSSSAVEDPKGPRRGYFRVTRGGGWHTGPGCMGVHYRNAHHSNWVDFCLGFRCARPAGESAASHLEHAFADSGLAGGIRRFWAMKGAVPGTYYFSESELIEASRRLLDAGRTIEALEVFRLVRDCWPDSPYAYSNLGEAYLKLGLREAAVRHFREALRLNPELSTAREALEQLGVPVPPTGAGSE